MEKFISEFYLNIYRKKSIYENIDCDNITKKLMLARVNALLRHYKEEEWASLQEYYYDYDYAYGICDSIVDENLILLILLDAYKDKLKEYDMGIIDAIIEAFIYTSVNPYNFERYVKIFLNPDIYPILVSLNESPQLTPVSYICIGIIETGDIDFLERKDCFEVKKILNRFNGEYYSPIFDGNYSFFNIYSRLRFKMNYLNKRNKYFNDTDYKILLRLVKMESELNEVAKEDLVNRIKSFEENYDYDPRGTIKEIIYSINSFYNAMNISVSLKRKKGTF